LENFIKNLKSIIMRYVVQSFENGYKVYDTLYGLFITSLIDSKSIADEICRDHNYFDNLSKGLQS